MDAGVNHLLVDSGMLDENGNWRPVRRWSARMPKSWMIIHAFMRRPGESVEQAIRRGSHPLIDGVFLKFYGGNWKGAWNYDTITVEL